jgi:hypothetical protein
MRIFGRREPVSEPAPEWLWKTVQGYLDKPRSEPARLVAQGWEVVSVTPVLLKGYSLKQSIYMLRKRNPDFVSILGS